VGRYAPHLARLGRADISLSVELATFLAKITAFSSPVVAALLLHSRRPELRDLTLILELLVFQIAPLVAGQQLGKRRPGMADRMERPVRRAATLLMVVLLGRIALDGGVHGLRLLGSRGWLAVLAFTAIAGTLGWLVGGRSERARVSLAISALAPNLALALLLSNEANPGPMARVGVIGVWLALVLFDYILVRLAARRHVKRETPGISGLGAA
jgi:predicted Na+-dependent transporter